MEESKRRSVRIAYLLTVSLTLVLVVPMESQLEFPQVNTSPGPEYASQSRRWQGIPGIERAANGRLWVTWFSGGPKEPHEDNYVLLVTSGDDGKSWSEPKIVVDPPGKPRAYDPMLWHDPEGRLWFFWTQNAGPPGPYAIYCENSTKENPSWSPVRRIYPLNEASRVSEDSPPDHGDIVLNKPIVLKSGAWVLPVRKTHPTPRMAVAISTDKGESWQLYGDVEAPGPSQGEPMVVEKRDGSLWMLIRAAGGRIWESTSSDGGKSWSEGRATSIVTPRVRFHLRRLASGRLLLINTHHANTRVTLQASLSEDDGLTWSRPFMLDERMWVSYPDTIQASDGTIYAVHDRERHEAKEILLSVFSEADVLAGKSTTAHLNVIIDKIGYNRPCGPDCK